MNEYVYVEFLFNQHNCQEGVVAVAALGKDFVMIKSALEYVNETSMGYHRIKGSISSETATALKLSNTLLSNSMRISYISSDLKDKYRNR